jgi:hypothetical protein
MPIATNAQMQTFADDRLRPFAELFRNVLVSAREHKAAIDDVYARATQNPGTQWADNRVDGVPHLLKSGFANTVPANPDDMTNFNSFVTALTSIIDGQGTDATNAAALRSAWAVLNTACVRKLV